MSARLGDPVKFEPNVKAAFPGIDDSSLMLRDDLTFVGIDDPTVRLRRGQQIISFQGSDIISRGKAIGIPLGNNWWLNVHLRIHDYVVAISSKELSLVNSARLEDSDSDIGRITIQTVSMNEAKDGNCMIVVDRLRLTTLTFVDTTIASRAEFYKFDFNSRGCLTTNFIPHGAPAIVKDETGARRLWYGTVIKCMAKEKSKVPVHQLGAISSQRSITRSNSLQRPMTQYFES